MTIPYQRYSGTPAPTTPKNEKKEKIMSVQSILNETYLPRYPRVSNNPAIEGLKSVKREKALSGGFKFIETTPKTLRNYIALDLDIEQAERRIKSLAWDDEIIPEPNIITINPVSSHAHVLYLLASPVGTEKGLEFFDSVRRGLNRLAGGDLAYRGRIMRNPLEHPSELITDHLYTLAELMTPGVQEAAKVAKKEAAERVIKSETLGRNEFLFESLRRFSYKAIREVGFNETRFLQAVELKAMEINELNFDEKLPWSEVKATVRSVSKWVLKKFSKVEFSERQSFRSQQRWGNTKAERAAVVLAMKEEGASWEEMGEVLKSSPEAARRTYYRAASGSV